MAKILDKLFWTTAAKLKIINWLFDSMPESTKKVVIGRVLARQMPSLHLHGNPKRRA